MRVIYRSLGGLGSSDPRCHTKCKAGCIYCSKKKGSTKTVWDWTEEIYSVYIIYHHQIRNAAQRFLAGGEKRPTQTVKHSRQVELHPRAQISG